METLLTKLAEQGVVAIILSLSISANYFLYKEVRSVSDKRIQEAIETRNSVMEPLKAIQATVEIILTSIKK